MKQRAQKGFTLIELMIVMIIIAILAGLITGNFFTSLVKGRDARRKADLDQIQKTLEMYYEDNHQYPTSTAVNSAIASGGELCSPSGCDVKVYMTKIPNDPQASAVAGSPSYVYNVSADGQSYHLYATLENTQDTSQGVNQGGYGNACGGTCKFTLSDPGSAVQSATPYSNATSTPAPRPTNTPVPIPTNTPTPNIPPTNTPTPAPTNTPTQACYPSGHACNMVGLALPCCSGICMGTSCR